MIISRAQLNEITELTKSFPVTDVDFLSGHNGRLYVTLYLDSNYEIQVTFYDKHPELTTTVWKVKGLK